MMNSELMTLRTPGTNRNQRLTETFYGGNKNNQDPNIHIKKMLVQVRYFYSRADILTTWKITSMDLSQ